MTIRTDEPTISHLQTQIDDLAAKVERLEYRLHHHAHETYATGAVGMPFFAGQSDAEPTPPTAPEPEDDARWEAVVAVAKSYLVEPHNEVLAVKAAVAEAVRQGLAASADRAVVVSRLTDAMVERILDTLLDDPDFARALRSAVDDALRAAERGEG